MATIFYPIPDPPPKKKLPSAISVAIAIVSDPIMIPEKLPSAISVAMATNAWQSLINRLQSTLGAHQRSDCFVIGNGSVTTQIPGEQKMTRSTESTKDFTKEDAREKAAELRGLCKVRKGVGRDSVANSNEIRSLIWWFHQDDKYKSLSIAYTSTRKFLKAEIPFNYSYLAKQLKAAETEDDWGIEIGTYPEGILRPISQSSAEQWRATAWELAMASTDGDELPTIATLKQAIATALQARRASMSSETSWPDIHELPLDYVRSVVGERFGELNRNTQYAIVKNWATQIKQTTLYRLIEDLQKIADEQ